MRGYKMIDKKDPADPRQPRECRNETLRMAPGPVFVGTIGIFKRNEINMVCSSIWVFAEVCFIYSCVGQHGA